VVAQSPDGIVAPEQVFLHASLFTWHVGWSIKLSWFLQATLQALGSTTFLQRSLHAA